MPNKSKRRQAPEKFECRQCHDLSEWNVCFWCLRRCRRKFPHPTYTEAAIELRRLVPRPWEDPTLDIFDCRVVEGELHYHLGHVAGRRAEQLIERAERLRRLSAGVVRAPERAGRLP